MKIRQSFISTLYAALLVPVSVQAETVRTTTIVTPRPTTERVVYFNDFDLDKDGFVSFTEVGNKIFYEFDRDGNELIDNVEFVDNNNVVTVTPTQVETVTMVDRDDDGYVDVERREHNTFLQRSHLTSFDRDMDGLSPKEFVRRDFRLIDQDRDNAITLEEWQATYIASIGSTLEEDDRFNQ